ncbi:M20/M25/M40 family metallo-hydrolase [Alcanivorax jadensis]|uniref:M20/M25/M40 family metallo-hydrolase n=1 Tax=Alcanivorax jadensis TaxID=64988 RepID=UPI0026EFF7C1|nr:M20/M25/M40 family metallo-hydrolase [Alcanivorax jadensis]
MKRLLQLLVLAVLILLAVLVYNTLTLPQADNRVADLPELHQAMDEDAMVERLATALRFATLPEQPDAFVGFHDFLRASFPLTHQTLSLKTFGHSLLYHWDSNNDCPPQLLLAHQDVVPVSSPEKWQHPPFAGVVDDDFVWGRGALDDKGSLMAILEATEALLQNGQTPACDVYLAFGHDEEIGGREGAVKIAAWLEQQGLGFALILDEGGMMLPGSTLGLDRPVALMGIAEKGYMTVELQAEAEPGHSSRPPERTAIGDLAAAINHLQTHPRPASLSGPTRKMLEQIAPHQPFGKRLVFANLWLFEPLIIRQLEGKPETNALLRTTMAPTLLEAGVKENVLPATANATLNFRLAPGETRDSLQAYLQQELPDNITVTARGAFLSDPSAVTDIPSASFDRLAALARALPEQPVVAPYLLIAGTDARHYQHLSDQVFRFMPVSLGQDDLARFHGHNERLPREQYPHMVRFYAGLMLGR